MLKVSGKPEIQLPHPKTPELMATKIGRVTTSRISTPVQNCIMIRLGNFAPPHICEVAHQMFTRLVFIYFFGFFQLATVRPVRRFWRSVCQKTFHARMCLLGFPKTSFYNLTPYYPKMQIFGQFSRGQNFGSKRALTWGTSSVNTP